MTAITDINREMFDTKANSAYSYIAQPGLTKELIEIISRDKKEPEWMLQFRLSCLELFYKLPLPTWEGAPSLADLDMSKIIYYSKPDARRSKNWDDVPSEIKKTFERLGIPAAEQKSLAGAGAQFESSIVYHNLKKQWEEKGVIFEDCDVALQKYPELMKKYFMKCISPALHKFTALHGAVWSGGTFLYVPTGVKIELPLQAYFRMNEEGMGQFEHTLIIAEPGSHVSYIEGCSAPKFSENSLHAGCVEIFVHKDARVRYSSIENWSKNTYNLNTKRAIVEDNGLIEWINGNMGCLVGETKVFTNPKGPVNIKDIAPGSKVYAWDEKTNSLQKTIVKSKVFSGYKRVYRLEAGGRIIKASANHPFLTLTRRKNKPTHKKGFFNFEWKSLEQLTENDVVGIIKEFPTRNVAKKIKLERTKSRRNYSCSKGLNFASKVNQEIGFARINKIKYEGIVPTYDIEVEKYHNFIANGLIVHNSKATMLYPCSILKGPYAKSDFLGVAFAGKNQFQDTGAKVYHLAPHTSSTIRSKSISKDGGITTYRGLVHIAKSAVDSKTHVQCDALMADSRSQSHTIPFMDIQTKHALVSHEATVSKLSTDSLFYLMSRGLTEEQAKQMIVSGFVEPIIKTLPIEYAIELNRLIELEMEDSIG